MSCTTTIRLFHTRRDGRSRRHTSRPDLRSSDRPRTTARVGGTSVAVAAAAVGHGRENRFDVGGRDDDVSRLKRGTASVHTTGDPTRPAGHERPSARNVSGVRPRTDCVGVGPRTRRPVAPAARGREILRNTPPLPPAGPAARLTSRVRHTIGARTAVTPASYPPVTYDAPSKVNPGPREGRSEPNRRIPGARAGRSEP